jgi:MFS family permease
LAGRVRNRSVALLSTSATLAAFRIPGYPALWVSSAAGAISWSVGYVAFGWIALLVTGSPFAVALTFAARVGPALVLGIPLGAVVDRLDRRLTLIAIHLFISSLMLVVAGIAIGGALALPGILAFSVVFGICDTIRGTANQAYAVDLAGPSGATNAIALGNLGAALVGAIGSLVAGIVLESSGAGPTFALASLPSLVAATLLFLSHRRGHGERAVPRLAPTFRASLTLIARNRLVTLIAIVVITGEMFGWSTTSLYPTFAKDVLDVDAAGLGAMSAARSLGSMIGLLAIATAGLGTRGGLLYLSTGIAFGLGLAAFAISTSFLLSLALLFVLGAASSSFDTLGQTLLQRSVEDNERGASVGIWFFGTGFGPFGSLALGAIAAAAGGPVAMFISGAILATITAGLATVPRLRALR